MLSRFAVFFCYNHCLFQHLPKGGNMKKNKIIITLISVVIILSCLATTTFAAVPEMVQPRWASILSMVVDMSFDGSEGNATGTALKQYSADSIEGTVYVYKWVNNDWEYVGEAYNSRSVGSLGVSYDFVAESGARYKSVFTVTAYTDGVPETETTEYIKICP